MEWGGGDGGGEGECVLFFCFSTFSKHKKYH